MIATVEETEGNRKALVRNMFVSCSIGTEESELLTIQRRTVFGWETLYGENSRMYATINDSNERLDGLSDDDIGFLEDP